MCDEIIKDYFPDSSYWRVNGAKAHTLNLIQRMAMDI